MARYIDVDLAIGSINRILIEKENEKQSTAYFAFEKFKELLETAPTAPVSPIADTVRKMVEEASQMCFIVGDEEYVTLRDLDQIAKELLEENQ